MEFCAGDGGGQVGGDRVSGGGVLSRTSWESSEMPGILGKHRKNTDIKKIYDSGLSFQSDLPFSSIGLKSTQLFIQYLPSDSIIWSV